MSSDFKPHGNRCAFTDAEREALHRVQGRKPQGKLTQAHRDRTKYTRKEKHRGAVEA